MKTPGYSGAVWEWLVDLPVSQSDRTRQQISCFLVFNSRLSYCTCFVMGVKVYIPLPTQTITEQCICGNSVKRTLFSSDALTSPPPSNSFSGWDQSYNPINFFDVLVRVRPSILQALPKRQRAFNDHKKYFYKLPYSINLTEWFTKDSFESTSEYKKWPQEQRAWYNAGLLI